MAVNQGGKGNPAHKRMSNPKRKANRASSWNRAQVKKAKNRELNHAQHLANLERFTNGEPTPHEVKKAKRRAKRDALREQGLLPQIGTTRKEWELQKKRKAA